MKEQQLLEQAVSFLREKVPKSWSVELYGAQIGDGVDATLELRGPQSGATLMLEAKTSITPREIQALLGPSLLRRIRAQDRRPILLVAPYLSPRSRELLTELDVAYLDLTGNARIVLDYPSVWVETTGAQKNPSRQEEPSRRLRGVAAGRLIRALVDACPPYGVTDLAKAARLDPGYTTRLLETLDAEALVTRSQRGKVADVDWEGLLRRRAREADLFKGDAKLYVARAGAPETFASLAESGDPRLIVSGSFAAACIAPVTAPALLVAYTLSERDVVAADLALLPVAEGGDVLLIRPKDEGPFFNVSDRYEARTAAPSQVAIDCLSGNGRMPSEGEAVIEWMKEDTTRWRAASLDEMSWSVIEK